MNSSSLCLLFYSGFQSIEDANMQLQLGGQFTGSTCVCARKSFQSCLTLTLWTVACQAPLPTGFSREEYWNGLPCTSPADLPDPGIEPTSLESPALAEGFFTIRATWEDHGVYLRKY